MNRGCPASAPLLVSSACFETLESRRLLSAVLAADINRLPGSDYKPLELKVIGNVAYFAQHDGVNGMEMWRTDGTVAGTSMVADLFAGLGSSEPNGFTRTADGTIYFSATDPAHGYELWKTDGTAAGTVLVKDIRPGPAISVPLNLTAMGNKVYFSADDGVHGREVWVSDGTAAGTQMLVDLRPGATGQNTNYTPLGMTAVGSTLFFGGTDGSRVGLWTSNGAVGNVTFQASVPNQVKQIITFDNRAYFLDHNLQLWTSDGTPGGTNGISTSGSWVGEFVQAGGSLYYDCVVGSGSGQGVYRISPGSTLPTKIAGDFTNPTDIGNVGGDVYISAFGPTVGAELFVLPAGSTTATLVQDLTPGLTGSAPANLTGVGDALFFTTGGTTTGFTLYQTKGTAASTVPLKAVTAPGRVAPAVFTAVNGRLVFVNDDAATGQELWVSNGTTAGTGLLRDIYPGTGHSEPVAYTALDGKVLLRASDGVHGSELWSYDPASGAASMVADVNPGSVGSLPRYITSLGSVAVFVAGTNSAGDEVWVTDGTAAGTRLLKDILPGTFGGALSPFFVYNGRAYFSGNDGTHGTELWVTDGTPAGTVMVKDINPGSESGGFSWAAVMNGILYFSATDGLGAELWRTDGTADGTWRVKDVYAGSTSSSPAALTGYNGSLYFAATDAAAGLELWKSDGTDAGTVRVTDIRAGSTGSAVSSLAAAGPYLYFSANDGATGAELWRTDGTAGGTIRLSDAVPGSAGSNPGILRAMNDRLYFFARSTAGGYDLWQSGGTPGTTSLVKAVSPPGGITARLATVVSGRLFFVANEQQLWSSDGTPDGTAMVPDRVRGAVPAVIDPLFAFNGEIYAQATDSVSGLELWRFTDDWAPILAKQGFEARLGGPVATATFNEDATVDLSKLVVTNRTTGQVVPASNVVAAYDAASRTLSVSVRGSAGALPADGDYRVTIPAGSVVDRAGNVTTAAMNVDFFLLAGDATGDRVVNFDDLLVLAKNYNATGATLAQGDFDGNGTVNFDDLLILAKHYNAVLAAPPPEPAPVVSVAASAAEVTGAEVTTGTSHGSSSVLKKGAPAAKPAPAPKKVAPGRFSSKRVR